MQRKKTDTANLSKNVLLYYIAVGVIMLGYVFLWIGDASSFTSLTMGPIVLVFGYLVAMPIALLSGVGYRKEDKKDSTTD